MQQATVDELTRIQQLWPSFEELVGLRGRKMYAQVDERRNTYTVCTPVKEDDRPDGLGLELGTLAGGSYLRGRLVGDPAQTYGQIAAGMAELKGMLRADDDRPLVEFYRRHDQIELWVPIRS
ncbi:GyrI-like domain-containing protein [Streptomyces sp. HC44]|uniref:GyrI-like domain-containing protein n=1 Tax=Streptomyces scabichelini TaxID=2711217 RepID=A0A6G4VI89_9ACTN|nr:GyrI-like domain-containing protein [Streptomyces scabichelini]NGO13816.1 GyrI-like domain-containing protein [Streptomyces scabichelini]